MTSLETIAVDVVNVTVADAVFDATAVVMLRAVAAAATQPMHGVFTRAAIVSLLVKICRCPASDANDAARATVVSPLHVTVTAPAGTAAPPGKVTVITPFDTLVVHTIADDIKPQAGAAETPKAAAD